MGAGIKLSPFGPLTPRTAERNLPEGFSQAASNVNLLSGEIRPIKQPLSIDVSLADCLAVYRAEYNGEVWRGWNMDVDVAVVPLAADVETRYVWTGDGPPKWSKFSGFDSPANDLTLGIPNPVTAPSVSPSGGVGATVSRLYVYTFWSQDGEESGPSPASTLTTGKVDDTWAITGMDAVPLNTGVISTAVKDTPANAQTQVTCTAPHWLRTGDQVTIASVTGLTDLNATWTVTVVDSTKFYVDLDTSQTYSSGGTWTRVAPWNTTNMTRRLYRSAGTNASYQLVAENISGTTYDDTITDYDIPGDELVSASWAPPPAGLFAIGALPSGAMVGVVGSLLCFSEPYQAHAWPTEYQFGMGHQAVALATYGTTVVVGTLGKPYIADGVDPASTSLQAVDNVWPCLSKRSMISVGDGVAYATLHGMCYIGAGGPKIWTQPYFTREEWRELAPSTMVSAATEAKIFVRYMKDGDPTAHILIFMPTEPLAQLTTLDLNCVELYGDARNGKLYIVDSEAVKEYDAGVGNRLVYEWKSKEYELTQPVNFGAARVEFVSEMTAADVAAAQAAYDAAVTAVAASNVLKSGNGALNGLYTGVARNSAVNGYTPTLPQVFDSAYVNFTMYSKGLPVFGALLYSDLAFRLPAGFKTDAVSFKLNGTVRVKNVKIAETMDGLRKL